MTVTPNDMTLPSWASHVEDKLAPMPLLLVQAFVDTLDRDLGTDIFAHPDEARAWLADAGLRVPDPQKPGGPEPGFADDLRLAREARDSIRALIGRNTGTEPLTADDLAPLQEVLGQAQPRLEVGADGRARLGPDRCSRPRRWPTACSGCCSSSGTRRLTATGTGSSYAATRIAGGPSTTARTAAGAPGATWPRAGTGSRTATCAPAAPRRAESQRGRALA